MERELGDWQPRCVHCGNVVDLDGPHWEVIEQHNIDDPREWVYAHADCMAEIQEPSG
jgi:hypothetical protein